MILIFRVGVNFDRIIPGVDVSFRAAGIRQISCGTQEDSRHVHQFAEWKIGRKEAHKEKMDVKNQGDPLWKGRLEPKHGHHPFLDLDQILLVENPHENAADSDAS